MNKIVIVVLLVGLEVGEGVVEGASFVSCWESLFLKALVPQTRTSSTTPDPRLDAERYVKSVREEVARYGLPPLDEHNHKKGKALILLALKEAPVYRDAALAHGLLGLTMLQCEPEDMVAYKSFLLALALDEPKMYLSTLSPNLLLYKWSQYKGIGFFPVIATEAIRRKSVISQRESIIYVLSENLNARCIYDDNGEPATHYAPEENRKSNVALLKVFELGLQLYEKLLKDGYADKTLGDLLGVVHASLLYDGVVARFGEIALKLGTPAQIYSDALEATLKRLRNVPGHTLNFLQELSLEMEARHLVTRDRMLLGGRLSGDQPLLKIIEKDLDDINTKK